MMKSCLYIFALMLVLVSCEQKPSVQKYFVEKSEEQNFATLDIAPNFVNSDSLDLSAEEKKALKSLHKLNVLVFKATDKNQKEFETEKVKVKGLLKEDNYDELMKISLGNGGASINTKGEGEHIEEFVVFVHNKQNGFGVVRVLGEDMTPDNVMTMVGLLQKGKLDLKQLEPLKNLMVNNVTKDTITTENKPVIP